MKKYYREHEASVTRALKNKQAKTDWPKLLLLHHKRLKFLQHERLVHLLVMLAFSAFSLLSFFALLLTSRLEVILLSAIFLITAIIYVGHYYYLENTTQRWYKLSDELEKRIKK